MVGVIQTSHLVLDSKETKPIYQHLVHQYVIEEIIHISGSSEHPHCLD